MKDTSNAIIEIRQILSQKIIPQVAKNESLRMILAQRPLRLPPDISVKRKSAPPLKLDSKSTSGLFLSQDKQERMHAIRVPYLCYVVEGEADIRLGIPVRQGKSHGKVNIYEIFTLPTNSFLFIPPGVFFPEGGFHWERAASRPADSRIFWLHILPTGAHCHTCTTRNGIHTSDNFNIFVPGIQLSAVTELLSGELQSSDTDFTLSASGALLLLLFHVRRSLGNSATASKRRLNLPSETDFPEAMPDVTVPLPNSTIIERTCDYIQRHRDLPLDVSTIASQAYVSPSYLAKLFRTNLRTTVMKYVLDQRMEAARSLLISTELSIKEIAHFTGYMQQPQFTRVFKQIHHIPPTEFRHKHLMTK